MTKPLVKTGSLILGLLLGTVPIFAADKAAGRIEYNRDIRPILAENCFACHGADSAARKAGLRLDHFADATAPRKDARAAIAPGKPNDSELVHRIFNPNADDRMPPEESKKNLKPEQKELLKQWIAQGAEYEAHWSLIAPKRPALPKVRKKSWVENPIDNFILAKLDEAKLKPAPEADRRTLARRVSLDLTGLPPKPEMVEAFVNDKSKNAYEKLVDKLLQSPQWGEHRARYWLDAARYADTHGIHFDNYREIWSYRDWVINAFNENKPFDEFTVEQLAGDLLPKHTLDQEIATGFNRCNITTSEGGAIDEEYLVLYARDRTETTSQVWLGLTMGCAVCHDHKFDPISQKEFYSMSAFFNNTTQKAMDGNVKDTAPTVVVPKTEDRTRWEKLPSDKIAAKSKMDARRKSGESDFKNWLASVKPETIAASVPKKNLVAHFPLSDNQSNALVFTVGNKTRTNVFTNSISWQEGAIADKAFTVSGGVTPEMKDVGNLERGESFSFATWVRIDQPKDGSVFARMDEDNAFRGWDFWLQQGRPGTHIISKWTESAIKVVAKKALETNRWSHVCITYDGSAKASGVKIYIDGELQDVEIANNTLGDKSKGSIRTKVPFKIGQRNKTSRVDSTGIQDIRLYGRTLESQEVKALGSTARLAWLMFKPAANRTAAESEELYSRWLTSIDAEYRTALGTVDALDKEERDIRMRGTVAHVMNERKTAPEAYVLSRGEYDKRKDKVEPNTPAALPPMNSDLPHDRLGLAKWLLAPENPLTARVTVNRFWQELFGVGIVKTSGDFGVTGEMPSHPELLDWLAVEFRESGWDVKKFFKLMVMSATYRQAAIHTPEKLEKDVDNRLLSRGPRFRMDAEMIRDYALEASGLLVAKIGGPSVKPYQPDGVWETVAMIGSDTRNYKQDTGENLYRRSLYTFWKRAAPPASMDVFNAPSRETCTVRRERTDTPLQALTTLNDPQFVEAARNLAQRALQKSGADEEKCLDFMARRLLARPLRSAEKKIAESVLKDLLAHYKAAPKDAEELIAVGESKADESLNKSALAAYTMVANQLLNLDEALNK